MGNLILSNDFITVNNSDITIRSERTGYPKIDIMDYDHLGLTSQANDLTKNDANPLYRIDLGSAQTVAGIFLNHINYDKIRFWGHATDLGVNWAAADFDSGSDHSVSQNALNGRRQIFLPLTAFNYRWIAWTTPVAASAVGPQTTYWETSSIAILDSYITLSKNMSKNYRRTAQKAYRDINLPSGGQQRVSLSDHYQVELECSFGVRTEADEAELWTLNRLDHQKPLVLYENRGSDEDAYLMLRNANYQGTFIANEIVRGNSISFKELI